MKTLHDDCWLPLPGSWEELVEPYDAQLTRQESLESPREQPELPMEVIAEPTGKPAFIASLSA